MEWSTSRFDAWTRRRIGRAATGGFALLLGSGRADARKKRKKKRCRKLTESCGGKKKCCKNYKCATVGIGAPTFCCRPTRQACTGIEGECCGDRVCNFISGMSGFRCCAIAPGSCNSNQDCCTGYRCNNEGHCIEVV